MPLIEINMAEGRTEEQKKTLMSKITDVTEKVETKTEAETVPEKNEVETESENKAEELEDDAGKDKTETVDA